MEWGREFALRAISHASPLVSKLPDGLGGDANPCVYCVNTVLINETVTKNKKPHQKVWFLFLVMRTIECTNRDYLLHITMKSPA